MITGDEDGYVSVVSPIENTPGERAGLNTGDRIVKVDNERVFGNRLDDAVALMRGEADTEVTLEVMKSDRKESITISVTREIIQIQTVRSEMLKSDVGYLRITNFDERTAEDFKHHAGDLKAQGATGILIDLRNNPGGLLTTAIAIADHLLDGGLIVYTEDRHGNRREEHADSNGFDLKMVVLINGGTASASEIVAGALQDHEKAVLIGDASFGKGLVQEMQRLPDGTGVKYTVSEYFTPSGRKIHDVGIVPDHVVTIPEELWESFHELELMEDPQVLEALELLEVEVQR